MTYTWRTRTPLRHSKHWAHLENVDQVAEVDGRHRPRGDTHSNTAMCASEEQGAVQHHATPTRADGSAHSASEDDVPPGGVRGRPCREAGTSKITSDAKSLNGRHACQSQDMVGGSRVFLTYPRTVGLSLPRHSYCQRRRTQYLLRCPRRLLYSTTHKQRMRPSNLKEG